jgi:hypothetical protein
MAQTSNRALRTTRCCSEADYRSLGADPHVMQHESLQAFPLLRNVPARDDTLFAAGHPSHPAAHVLIEEGCLYRVVVCPKSHSMPR